MNNDCVEPLRFPKKLKNRPGLSHFDYRIGTYAGIRDALLRNLDKTADLSQWTYRGADDPGIALLEGASILGDILTFYQDLYANEAYLRTAQWRESIGDLVRLLGYRLSPGLGGRALFAFEVKGDQPIAIPAAFPLKAEVEGAPKPVDFETVALADTTVPAIAYPWLSKFNLYRPLETPQIDGSTTEFYIQPPAGELSSPVTVKPGDRLIMGERMEAIPDQLNNAEIIIVDSVRDLHGIQLFKIKGELRRNTPVTNLTALKLGRSFHHFGFNGPRQRTKATTTTTGSGATQRTDVTLSEENISFIRAADINDHTNTTASTIFGVANSIKIVEPRLSADEFPLDGEVDDLPVGTNLVVQAMLYRSFDPSTPVAFTLVRTITNIRSTSVTWGLSTGTSSIVTLDQAVFGIGADFYFTADIRSEQFHETLSPALTLCAAMQPATPAIRNSLNFKGTPAQANNLMGRKLFFVKTSGEPPRVDVSLVTVTDIVESSETGGGPHPALHKVVVTPAGLNYADFPNAPPYKVTVYGNLVEATQGKTEALVPLGNGDSRLSFQTFELPKSPLTYFASASATPPEVPELQIYVNNRLWKRVPSFFNRKPDEEIYIVREDPDDVSWVQFGDGKTGARVPSGIKNVAAVYRSGTGAFGKLKTKTEVKASAKLDGLNKIQMPQSVFDGAQPEDGENAREAAPGKIQSLDRLVSLEDFESEALGIAGIAKAKASWELVNGVPQVVLTVLMEAGRSETPAQLKDIFARANRGRGPSRFPIDVRLGQLKYVGIRAIFGYDSTYLETDVTSAIQKALGISSGKPNVVDDPSGLFSLRRRGFGQKEYYTTVTGVIQQVPGVVWVQVISFDSLFVFADPAAVSLPSVVALGATVECENRNVLTLYKAHLQLIPQQVVLPEVRP